MNTFVLFNGDNYDEVLNFTTGYVHSDGKQIKLFVKIPFTGDVEIHKGDYILNQDGKISVRHV